MLSLFVICSLVNSLPEPCAAHTNATATVRQPNRYAAGANRRAEGGWEMNCLVEQGKRREALWGKEERALFCALSGMKLSLPASSR